MIKPKAIKRGSTIGLIAPAGPVGSLEELVKSEAALTKQGFNVVVGESCRKKYGYLSGSDEVRASDVNNMFKDASIDAIFCLRGGYGTPRILDMLDYDAIRMNPKILMGYSDITGLHIALNTICGLVTIHGPITAYEMTGNFPDFSMESYMKAITSALPLGELKNPPGEEIMCLKAGKAEGQLIGGNLSLIAATTGTPYEIDTTGRILFLEEIGEFTYRVDRMLTQLRLAGKFDACAGVVIGDFKDCSVENGDYGLTLAQVFNDVIATSGKPVIYNLKAGHCSPKLTIPLGVQAVLDAGRCSLTITEAALI